MSYLGTKPANSPLTSELIPNSIITNDKINDVAASKLTGTVPDANAPSGSVIQVVSATKTDTFSTTSQSFVDVTGLSVNITPTSTSNKILVMIAVNWSTNGHSDIRLLRNGTPIAIGDASGSRVQSTNHIYLGWTNGQYTQEVAGMTWLDSPTSTSAVTYKLQIANPYSTYTTVINRSVPDENNSYDARTVSSITVMEIAA
jgi:hypothetical protein